MGGPGEALARCLRGTPGRHSRGACGNARESSPELRANAQATLALAAARIHRREPAGRAQAARPRPARARGSRSGAPGLAPGSPLRERAERLSTERARRGRYFATPASLAGGLAAPTLPDGVIPSKRARRAPGARRPRRQKQRAGIANSSAAAGSPESPGNTTLRVVSEAFLLLR